MLFSLLLVGCQRNQLVDGTNGTIVAPPQPPVRPDIPRTEPPIDQPIQTNENPDGPIIRKFLNSTIITRSAPTGIVAGDATHPFLLGSKLGDLLPLLTRNQLSILAGPQPSLEGRPLRAEQYVRFDFEDETSGELRYLRDEETDRLRGELFFAEGKPVFEYAYLLHDGAFPPMIGERIAMFGHTYLLKEASNTSLALYGQDVEQYLHLSNGSPLSVNGKSYPDTKVTVDPWHVTITYYGRDDTTGEPGIHLLRGQHLRDKLAAPLLNNGFDIVYDGFEQNPNDTMTLLASDNGVTLSYYDGLGVPVSFRLFTKNGTLGQERSALHLEECASGSFCVKNGEQFATRSAAMSRIFVFESVSTLGDALQLRDLATNEEHLLKLVDTKTKKNGLSVMEATLDFDRQLYRISVLFNESPRDSSLLAADQDGDGRIDGDTIAFPAHAFHEITVPKANRTNSSAVVELTNAESLAVDATPFRIKILFGGDEPGFQPINLTLAQQEDDDVYEGMTSRGVQVTLRSNDGITGDKIVVSYPADYRAGLVRILG